MTGVATTILVVANSARMLVQAACDAGFKPLAIDLFADTDTRRYAADFRQVPSLAERDLIPAVEDFVRRFAVSCVIYGSGFEGYPESLFYLSNRLSVLGNDPEVFARQLDKRWFFSVLSRMHIPFPEVVFNAPDFSADWLIKPMRGQGGFGIKRYLAEEASGAPVYWQKFQSGETYSVLFLADACNALVIGFNSQQTVRLAESDEFIFSGVISHAILPEPCQSLIRDWLAAIVPEFGLKGLNSLDFICEGECCYLLEVNPRPPASMQLYGEGLLPHHIEAITNGLDSHAFAVDTVCSGYRIIYAERDLIVPKGVNWPDWCMDLPKNGDMCRAGQPICSIIAHQYNSRSVAEQLQAKQQLIICLLERF